MRRLIPFRRRRRDQPSATYKRVGTSTAGRDADTDKAGALRRSWRLLPRALYYLRPYRRLAWAGIGLTILLSVAALAEPWPLAFIIDTVLGEEAPPSWITSLVGDGTGALILAGVVGLLVITAVNGVLGVINEYVTTKVDQRMVLDFRSDLFQHAQRLSLAFHDNSRVGVLMYKMNDQADSVGSILIAIPALAQSVLTLLGMVYIVYRIDPTLALVALAIVPFVYYSTTYYANRIEPNLIKVRDMEGRNLSIVHETMTMLRVVVAFGREKQEYQRFRKQGEETVDARIKLTVRQTLFKLAVSFLTAAGTAAVLGVGAFAVLDQRISPGDLLVVMSYVAAVYYPLETMTNSMASFQEHFMSFDHALSLLDTPIDIQEKEDAITLERTTGRIDFHEVDFSYPGRPDTLQKVSFSVRPGEAVALVGPTGAGKSTLASLMPRLYDPAGGRVEIDGVDVRDLTIESVRAQFSIVLQEPLLFSGSIADNIRYGRPDASMKEVQDAARAANAHDFIQKLPEKYHTRLGERGTKISGGERQRIAVARAFLRDAPILILDEPTSSIDSRTEGVILEALERLMEGRTTIMIAHRLSTIRSTDRILVLNEGELVQQGTHEELVQEGGLYGQLWHAQTRNPDRKAVPVNGATPPAPATHNGNGNGNGTANGNGKGATGRVPLVLREGDRATLEDLARSEAAAEPARQRARIVLLAAEGRSNRAIGAQVNLHPTQVGVWRKRYEVMGVDGLSARERARRAG